MLLNLTENDFFLKTFCGLEYAEMYLPRIPLGELTTHEALPNPLVVWERALLPNPDPTKEKDGIYRFCVRI